MDRAHPGFMTPTIEAPPGLKGVVVADTELGDVRGEEGFYHYRQYSAIELAEVRSLEDVWFLQFHGHLPTAAERARFAAEVAPLRELDGPLPDVLATLAKSAPLDGLRSAVSVLAAAQPMRPVFDLDEAARRSDALHLCAVTPTVLAALYRLRHGLTPLAPRPDLAAAANYLWMVTGRAPAPDEARAIEQYLIATIDHGFNASTFTARVIASTGADMGACVVGAIAALSGPLHGGAPSRALETIDAIGSAANIDPYIRPRIEAGERIMGFGHAVYRTEDPRSRLLHAVARRLGGDRIALAEAVERRVVELLAELKPGRQLYANVEFYAGVVMERCGLPPEMFTPTFAASRVIGWCAHVLEQARVGKLIRPSARYVGPPPPEPVPA